MFFGGMQEKCDLTHKTIDIVNGVLANDAAVFLWINVL